MHFCFLYCDKCDRIAKGGSVQCKDILLMKNVFKIILSK